MITVTTFYKFCSFSERRLAVVKDEITQYCEARDIKGLLLLSPEGCNATMAGPTGTIPAFKVFLEAIPEIQSLVFKDFQSDTQPFRRLKVDLREEIVTLKRPDIFPTQTQNHHLSPAQWHKTLTTEKDFVLIDTRNTYETKIGSFRGAVDPAIDHFSQFPQFVSLQNFPKDQKILMFCTGGIRCEKALVYMQQEGYRNVFQLEGGILNYLKEYPDGEFLGECFVFDHRVALDKNLEPSRRYGLCPHCGEPAKELLTCSSCGSLKKVCSRCREIPERRTCSKNCAHHEARKLNRLVG